MGISTLVFLSTPANYPDNAVAPYSLGEAYPTTRNGLTFGVVSTSGAGNTASVSNITGQNGALTYGRLNLTSTARLVRIDLPEGPGQYKVRVSSGIDGSAGTNVDHGIRIFDGPDPGSDNLLHDTGSVVFDRSLFLDLGGVTHADAANVETNGAEITLDLSGPIYVTRGAASNAHLNFVTLEKVSQPLQPLEFNKPEAVGPDATVTAQDKIHANERIGMTLGVVKALVGAGALAITGGALSPHVELATVGSDTVVRPTSFIPKGTAATLEVTQTTPEETKVTTFDLGTVVDSGTKPVVGPQARIPTEQWLHYEEVKAEAGKAWEAPASNTLNFASDVVVSGVAALQAALDAVAPTGSSWHRIRLQDDTYTGSINLPTADFGTGGLILEPDTGHDPDFSCDWSGETIGGFCLRNIKSLITNAANILWRFSDQPEVGFASRVHIDNPRIGRLFDGAKTQQDVIDEDPLYAETLIYFGHGESFRLTGGDFNGVEVGMSINAVRYTWLSENAYKAFKGDYLKYSIALDYDTPHDFFADGNCWFYREGDVAHEVIDYLTYNSGAHQDFGQIATHGQNRTFWYALSGPEGKQGPNGQGNYQVGNTCKVPDTNSIWEVVSAPTTGANGYAGGITGATLPTEMATPGNTSQNVVDGELVWKFIGRDWFAELGYVAKIYWKNCVVHCAGSLGVVPSVQFFINSDGGQNHVYDCGFENCIAATANSRGVSNSGRLVWNVRDINDSVVDTVTRGSTRNKVMAHRCSWVKPANTQAGYNKGQIYVENGVDVLETDCLFGIEQDPSDDSTVYRENCAVVDFQTSGQADSADTLLRGTGWTLNTGKLEYPLVDSGLLKDELVSELSKQLHYSDGSIGARLREVHDISGHELVIDVAA